MFPFCRRKRPIYLIRISVSLSHVLSACLLCTVSFSVSGGLFMDPSVVVGKLDFTRRYWCCRLSSLSLSLEAGKRRLFNCLEEKIAVSTSLSPFPSSRLPISFEAKLQFGRTVIFQIRPCSNAQKKTCFSVFVSLPSYMISIWEWLLKHDVLNSTQPGQKLTLQLSRSWFTPLCMSAITLKCRFVEGAPGKRGRMEIAFRKCIICAILTTENRDTLSRKADK